MSAIPVAIVTADGNITQHPIDDVISDDRAYRGYVSTTAPIARVIAAAIGRRARPRRRSPPRR
jgi:hypothetical protein